MFWFCFFVHDDDDDDDDDDDPFVLTTPSHVLIFFRSYDVMKYKMCVPYITVVAALFGSSFGSKQRLFGYTLEAK